MALANEVEDILDSIPSDAQILYLRALKPASEMLQGMVPLGTKIPWYEVAHVWDGDHTHQDPQAHVKRCLEDLEQAGLVRQWWGASLPGQERGLLVEVLPLENQDAA